VTKKEVSFKNCSTCGLGYRPKQLLTWRNNLGQEGDIPFKCKNDGCDKWTHHGYGCAQPKNTSRRTYDLHKNDEKDWKCHDCRYDDEQEDGNPRNGGNDYGDGSVPPSDPSKTAAQKKAEQKEKATKAAASKKADADAKTAAGAKNAAEADLAEDKMNTSTATKPISKPNETQTSSGNGRLTTTYPTAAKTATKPATTKPDTKLASQNSSAKNRPTGPTSSNGKGKANVIDISSDHSSDSDTESDDGSHPPSPGPKSHSGALSSIREISMGEKPRGTVNAISSHRTKRTSTTPAAEEVENEAVTDALREAQQQGNYAQLVALNRRIFQMTPMRETPHQNRARSSSRASRRSVATEMGYYEDSEARRARLRAKEIAKELEEETEYEDDENDILGP
jgi:hypothetical protein